MGALWLAGLVAIPIAYWFLFNSRTMDKALWHRRGVRNTERVLKPLVITTALAVPQALAIAKTAVPINDNVHLIDEDQHNLAFVIGRNAKRNVCVFTINASNHDGSTRLVVELLRWTEEGHSMLAADRLTAIQSALLKSIQEADPAARANQGNGTKRPRIDVLPPLPPPAQSRPRTANQDPETMRPPTRSGLGDQQADPLDLHPAPIDLTVAPHPPSPEVGPGTSVFATEPWWESSWSGPATERRATDTATLGADLSLPDIRLRVVVAVAVIVALGAAYLFIARNDSPRSTSSQAVDTVTTGGRIDRPTHDISTIPVYVVNGTGVSGASDSMTATLTSNGYLAAIPPEGSAPPTPTTRVYYFKDATNNYQADAAAVAALIGAQPTAVQPLPADPGFDINNATVIVYLGPDLDVDVGHDQLSPPTVRPSTVPPNATTLPSRGTELVGEYETDGLFCAYLITDHGTYELAESSGQMLGQDGLPALMLPSGIASGNGTELIASVGDRIRVEGRPTDQVLDLGQCREADSGGVIVTHVTAD